jgi:putative ATP-binding cassette transporter
LQKKRAGGLLDSRSGRFSYLAFAYIIIAVYKFYLTQLLQLRWRAWMTGHYTTRWLANHAFYRMELARFTQPEGAAGKGHRPTTRTSASRKT